MTLFASGRTRVSEPGDAPPGHVPTVSVILPVYNVENYLEECLDSIVGQQFSDFEVVVVDDGSPDRSATIAARYAERDERIRLVARPNGGLGAARNTGVRHAAGRYLTFVDSDDAIPRGALRRLVESAEESGAEIVVGALRRFNSLERWKPAWVDEVHSVARSAVTLDAMPGLVRNNHAVAKLYRADFWNAGDYRFREGVAYEDQPLVAELYADAGAIDVLPDSVYRYRCRDDRTALSQQTASMRDLRDRVESWMLSHRELGDRQPSEVHETWLRSLFEDHFHRYLRSPAVTDDRYWQVLQRAVATLSDAAPAAVWDAVSPELRVAIELARQDRRDDLLSFYRRDGMRMSAHPAEPHRDGALCRLPFVDDAAMPDRLFVLPPERLVLEHEIHGFRWLDGVTAQIRGWSFIRQVDLAHHPTSTQVVLRERASGQERVFDATVDPDPGYPAPVEHDRVDYRAGAFVCTLDLEDVVQKSLEEGRRWTVHLRTTTGGLTCEIPVRRLIRSSSAGVVPAGLHADGHRVIADWKVREPLELVVAPYALEATDVLLSGRVLSGSLVGPYAHDIVALALVGSDESSVSTPLDTGDGGSRTFALELPAAGTDELGPGGFNSWRVRAELTSGEWVDVTYRADRQLEVTEAHRNRVDAIERTRNGVLAAREHKALALADGVEVDPAGVLHLSGRLYGARTGPSTLRLRVRSRKTVVTSEPVEHRDGSFSVSMPLEYTAGRFGAHPLPAAAHDLSCEVVDESGVTRRVPLAVSEELGSRLPVPVVTESLDGRVIRGPENRVRIALARPVHEARGAYRQRRLRSTLGAAPAGGLRHAFLCRSYFGESATCNGVGILRELQARGADIELYWAVTDYSVPVPDGARAVAVNSREWYELLGSAKYYLDNMFQPDYHRKPPGQVLIQTFHGYPFKTMGYPHWAQSGASAQRVESYQRRAAEWDYLVSPASYATPLLRRDFGYDGDVLEIGYPRNDVLLADDAPEIRDAVRAALGIAEHQRAVLYAPTFRDYESPDDHRAAMIDLLDIDAVTRGLGSDTVLLVRGHAFNARAGDRPPRRPSLVDVTDYPEVSDLYLASDAAIVDYSSLRFDYAVTGKPMVFHVPDLERYRSTRGCLLDFEPTAPGPRVSRTDEVIACLRDLDRLRAEHREQYAAFRRDYLDLEDGRAAARFVDAVLVPRGDAPPR